MSESPPQTVRDSFPSYGFHAGRVGYVLDRGFTRHEAPCVFSCGSPCRLEFASGSWRSSSVLVSPCFYLSLGASRGASQFPPSPGFPELYAVAY